MPRVQSLNKPADLKRVVYVVSLFPSISETFIVREIAALVERGVDVRIISLKKPSDGLLQTDSAALLERAVHPRPLPSAISNTLGALFANPRAVLRAFGLVLADSWKQPVVALKSVASLFRALQHVPWLREFNPQLIHAHWATYPSTAAWALGCVLDRPFSFTSHAHDIFIENQLLGHKIRESALAVTISQHNVEWLTARATPVAAQKLKVIHCGVDMERSPWHAEPRQPLMMLAVGRLDPVKGFGTLVDALALLKARGVDVQCRLVGSGPLEQELKQRARDRGVAGMLDFVGAQPQEQIRAWMSEAAVFVLPSQVADDGNRDGIPVALMEAMASGCPVISTRVSGIPELIEHDQDGLLVEQRNPAALADAVQRLLEDEPLRQRLAVRARRRIENEFDSRKEASRLHDLMAGVTDVA